METVIKPTNRVYRNVLTDKPFRLWSNTDTHEFSLISVGTETHAKGTTVNGWYLAAHTSMHIKLNTGKIVYLPQGTFYNLVENEQGVIEKVTHIKYCGFKRFTKIKYK